MPTITEVKSQLRDLKLPCTGSKERLEARLAAYFAGKPLDVVPAGPSRPELNIHPEVLGKCKELYAMCAFPHDEDLAQVVLKFADPVVQVSCLAVLVTIVCGAAQLAKMHIELVGGHCHLHNSAVAGHLRKWFANKRRIPQSEKNMRRRRTRSNTAERKQQQVC